MTDHPEFYPTLIPLGFFIWGPVLVMLLFWLMGLYASRQGVFRALEAGWSGFDRARAEEVLSTYGEQIRRNYRRKVLPADAAFALTYALVGAGIVAGLSMRGYPWWLAALCGGGWLFGGLCDVVEGFGIARLLDKFPVIEQGDVAFASGFTRLKLVLFSLGIMGAVVAAYLAFKPLAT